MDFKGYISRSEWKSKAWIWGSSVWIHTECFFFGRPEVASKYNSNCFSDILLPLPPPFSYFWITFRPLLRLDQHIGNTVGLSRLVSLFSKVHWATSKLLRMFWDSCETSFTLLCQPTGSKVYYWKNLNCSTHEIITQVVMVCWKLSCSMPYYFRIFWLRCVLSSFGVPPGN